MTRISLPTAAFLGFTLMVLFPGCRSFTPPVTYYTLNPIAEPSAAAETDGNTALTIGIRPVELPGYINRTQMVRRTGPNQLEVSSLHRWADYPDRLVQQMLGKNLQTLMPDARVVNGPWPMGLKPDIVVSFKFLELIGTADKKVLLSVAWQIAGFDASSIVKSYRLNLTEPMTGSSFNELAAAHSRVLATICRKVVESMRAYSIQSSVSNDGVQ